MTRNKNTEGTGDRGEVPGSLVGRIFKLDRKVDKLEKENEELKKRLDAAAAPAPLPAPAPPPPPPEPKKTEKKPEPEPKKKHWWEKIQ